LHRRLRSWGGSGFGRLGGSWGRSGRGSRRRGATGQGCPKGQESAANQEPTARKSRSHGTPFPQRFVHRSITADRQVRRGGRPVTRNLVCSALRAAAPALTSPARGRRPAAPSPAPAGAGPRSRLGSALWGLRPGCPPPSPGPSGLWLRSIQRAVGFVNTCRLQFQEIIRTIRTPRPLGACRSRG
jgi:hypothetical protein